MIEYGENGRPLRKAKNNRRQRDDYDEADDEDHEMEGLEEEGSNDYKGGDSEFEMEEGGGAKKKKGATRKAKKGKEEAWDNVYTVDDNDDSHEGGPKPAKKQRQAKGEPRQPKKPKEMANPNMIKTSNKLIGEIENRELYNSDDEAGCLEQPDLEMMPSLTSGMSFRNEELDLGQQPRPKDGAKKMDFLLKKL